MTRIILKIVIALIGAGILLVAGLLLFLRLSEFMPPSLTSLPVEGNSAPADRKQVEFTLMTWNIGYAGLGAETDFFYDGGSQVRAGKEESATYLDAICTAIKSHDYVDFFFFQEIDAGSKRSWYVDQYDQLSSLLPGFSRVFSTNYRCAFIPAPVTDPLGRVNAGLSAFSRVKPDGAMAQYFDAYFRWPERMIMLKRCFITTRFHLAGGRDLVLINTHNSAYDSSGMLRQRELFILDSVMKKEYRLGNYVIAGGDWNSNPRGFRPSVIQSGDRVTTVEPPIGSDFLPGWHFVYDSVHPSNRYLDMPYVKGKTNTTVLDFFVISPNLTLISIQVVPLGFAASDHEPVVMRVRAGDR